jgi:N-acetyl-alpha-D-muramate 1-phosphate uridylyltransferase
MTTLTHAMILAAGLGTRMRPLTLERPKPLVEVAGRTLLDHVLDRLEEAGIGDVVVNTHYKAEMIERHLARRGAERPRTAISREDVLLETGGGVRKALPLLGKAPFLVVNSDALWLNGPRSAIGRMARAWDADRMDALLLLVPVVAATGYDGPGDFLMDPDGKLARRKPGLLSPFIFGGVQIASPDLYRDTPEGPFSNNLPWNRALEAGRLFGIRHDGPWFHIGTPESIGETEQRLDHLSPSWSQT